jgi:hypothetical protein
VKNSSWNEYALPHVGDPNAQGIILESLCVRRPYLALIQSCENGLLVKFLHKTVVVATYEVQHNGRIVGQAHPSAFFTFVCIEEAHHKAKKRLGYSSSLGSLTAAIELTDATS